MLTEKRLAFCIAACFIVSLPAAPHATKTWLDHVFLSSSLPHACQWQVWPFALHWRGRKPYVVWEQLLDALRHLLRELLLQEAYQRLVCVVFAMEGLALTEVGWTLMNTPVSLSSTKVYCDGLPTLEGLDPTDYLGPGVAPSAVPVGHQIVMLPKAFPLLFSHGTVYPLALCSPQISVRVTSVLQ